MHRLVLAALLTLSACGHSLTLLGKDGGVGNGTASSGIGAGTVKLSLGGEIYSGQWTATDTGMNSEGMMLARAESGKHLRCLFTYGGLTFAGFGSCKDAADKAYALQIH